MAPTPNIMRYVSTRGTQPAVSLLEAVMHNTAADGGIYLPEVLPRLPEAFFKNFVEMDSAEIAFVAADRLFGEVIDSSTLKSLIDSAFNFPVKTTGIERNIHALELFHGPTLAFKDFGARFMARLLEKAVPAHAPKRRLTMMVSTTGNTGGAVANAMAGVSHSDVFILFPPNPAGRSLQRQFTTLGGNIHPIEVQGTIDDCSRLVRQALADNSLQQDSHMISGNSANIARLLPQILYYFIGMASLASQGINPAEVTLSIPCGNLGNLCAAVMAKQMGLPMKRIIACENTNSTLARAFEIGRFERRSAIPTLAYAADKGRPSNAERLFRLCENHPDCRDIIVPHSTDDAAIIEAVNSCRQSCGYLLDPHSAMAYDGLKKNLAPGQPGLMLATAHPAKSLATMTAITGRALDLPLQLNAFMTGRDHRVRIAPSYSELKKLILATRHQNF